MTKIEQLNTEINYIRNKKYQDNLKVLIQLLPDYFFKVPAASTGKYHPSCSLGEGGLLRHTKTVARIAFELYNDESITGCFNQDEKDLMMVGMILHDGLKHGLNYNEYVVFDHPLVMCDFIKNHKEQLTFTDNEINFLTNVISSHMGPFTKDYKGNEVLPKPVNKYQKFVHMCDYIASRRFLNINFENNEIV